jgi:hypothetical protein
VAIHLVVELHIVVDGKCKKIAEENKMLIKK